MYVCTYKSHDISIATRRTRCLHRKFTHCNYIKFMQYYLYIYYKIIHKKMKNIYVYLRNKTPIGNYHQSLRNKFCWLEFRHGLKTSSK